MPSFLAEQDEPIPFLDDPPDADAPPSLRPKGGPSPEPPAPARPVGAGGLETIREIIAKSQPQLPQTMPLEDAVRAAQKKQAEVAAKKPVPESPRWWQRVAAGAVGGLAGYANAAGRVHVDPTAAVQGIYDVPGQQRKMAGWQKQEGLAEQGVATAQGNLAGWQQKQHAQSQEETAAGQREHLKAQTAAIPGQAQISALEHGGEILPDDQATPAGREGSVQDIGGKKIFFPSKGQQAKDKKEADQVNWRPLPALITTELGLPDGFKVPAAEVDSYVRIYEKKQIDPALKFESHVDENTGNVTTVGRDSKTGALKFQDTIKGIAAKRPQITQVQVPGLTASPGQQLSKLTGQEFLESLPAGTANQVKAIAEGRAALPPLGTRGSGALLRDAVFRYDPDFSEQRAQIRKSFTAGPDGRNIGALNTATVHLDQLADVAIAMGNGTFVPGNQLYNAVRAAFGSSAPTNFAQLKAAVAGEMASALKGNATDPEIATISHNLQAAGSPKQLADGIETNLHVLGAKLNTYHERYSQQLPNDKVWSPILPAARSVYLKHRFDPAADSGGGGTGAPIVQHSPSTGQYRYSIDGGKTWLPGQPPK